MGELEIGWRMVPNGFIAVTGTNGKTTTTELIGAMYRAAGRPVAVAGNVGTPVSALAGRLDPAATVVCEVSSFQLEDSVGFRARDGRSSSTSPRTTSTATGGPTSISPRSSASSRTRVRTTSRSSNAAEPVLAEAGLGRARGRSGSGRVPTTSCASSRDICCGAARH